ncbi:hypothetical protein DM860_005059 [Cuscuta australis]|uniref:BZIP domain-containing protein n=1 Tax=Cuscuta australis TaxID=267555 RepID=A0A328DNE6_9ASTE|nr:hypothetical protein DM860_005059 [Cuscuta australis]
MQPSDITRLPHTGPTSRHRSDHPHCLRQPPPGPRRGLEDKNDERKERRMISNRESARRSRMRKQRQLRELWSHLLWLRGENQLLCHRLGRLAEGYRRTVAENARLREDAAELRKFLTLEMHCLDDDLPFP